jgi:hypothetical protein
MGNQPLDTTYLKGVRWQTGVKWAGLRLAIGSKPLK